VKKSTIIATAAALFAAGAIVSGASAQSTNRCAGVNAGSRVRALFAHTRT